MLDRENSAIEVEANAVGEIGTHEGAPVQIAQATSELPELPDAAKGARVGVEGGEENAADAPRTRFVADASNTVQLPDGLELDNVLAEGRDLILVQADGTRIVIEGGALNVPTFVIGEVTIPQQVLIAALQENGLNIAAGPDGTVSVVTTSSSGGNLSDGQGSIGDAGEVIDLLGDTTFGFDAPTFDALDAAQNLAPEFADFAAGAVSEEGFPKIGLKDTDGDDDTTDEASISGTFPATDPEGGPLTFAFGLPTTPLKSNGQDIQWVIENDVLFGYTGTGEGRIDIIRAEISGNGYTITLLGQIDHPDKTTEDVVSLQIPVIATDVGGLSTTANMTVRIEDDSPQADITLIKGGLYLDETGTIEAAPDFFENYGTALDTASGKVFSTDGSKTGGDVRGSSTTLSLELTGTGETTLQTTDGRAISLHQVGDVIEGRTEDGDIVFAIAVEQDGTMHVSQYLALKHPDKNDHNDALDLDGLINAVVTVVDGDGDKDVARMDVGQHIVFKDDGPTLAETLSFTAAENDILNVRSVGSSPFSSEEGVNSQTQLALLGGGFASTVTDSVANAVNFGADGQGGFSFTANAVSTLNALGLTSKSGTVIFTIVGDTIIGYVNGALPGFQPVLDRPVMSFKLESDGNFTFRLYDQLDHQSGNGENIVLANGRDAIDFGAIIKATDGDGDSVTLNGKVNIVIKDDVPQLEANPAQTQDIDIAYTIQAGNVLYRGLQGEGDFDLLLTARSGSNAASVNTTNTDAAVANGWIDTGANETLRIDLMKGLVTSSNPSPGYTAEGRFGVDEFRFSVPQVQGGPSNTATIFIQLFAVAGNDDLTSTGADFSSLSVVGVSGVLVNGAPIASGNLTPVVNGAGDTIGYNISGIKEGDVITIKGEGDFGRIEISNPAGGKDFSIGGLGTTVTVPVAFEVRHDETKGVNTGADPNPADDTNAGVPSALASKIAGLTLLGKAVSGGSVSGLFTYEVGADEPASITYSLTSKTGQGFNGEPTGLTTTVGGHAIALYSDGAVVWGVANGDLSSGTKVFAAYIDASGKLWLAQFQAIAHNVDGSTPDAYDDVASVLADVRVTLTIVDRDGDPATATSNTPIKLSFQDDGPTITADTTKELTISVDETMLGTPAAQSFAGVFTTNYGTDGKGSLTYSLGFKAGDTGLIDTASGKPVVLSLENGLVVGKADGQVVFTVSVNDDGLVTLQQLRPVKHPTNDPNEPVSLSADDLITLTATAKDGDGDTKSASVGMGKNLVFLDDGPSISVTSDSIILRVDESYLSINAKQSFAGAFTSQYGADGAGSIAYTLGINSGATGLVDTQTGATVVLSMDGQTVIGTAGAGGPIVFKVSVDASGNVTLDQQRAISHPNQNDPNDSRTLAQDNLITLTATITDRDGDFQSAALNIGQNLVFKDDGPSISTKLGTIFLVVDESNLNVDASADFSRAFHASFGADGAGTITYALGINPYLANLTGLVDTASGKWVVLSLENGEVVGRAGTGGEIVFKVTVDQSGVVTLDQQRALKHHISFDHNDVVFLSLDKLVTLKATIVDGDGDKDSATLEIGHNLLFKDDGPTAVDDTMFLSEDAASVPGNVLTNDSAGADGGKLVTTTGTFNGTYGQLVLNADGSYVYTLKTDAATQSIIQGLSANQSLSESFNYTMKDGDGDLSSAKITLTINGADDIVTLAGLDVTGGEVKVSEANLANGTAPNAAALTVPGSFTVTSPDGMTKISIGGTEFTFAELAASSTTPLEVTTATGVLTITGFVGTAAGGTVSYSYLLQSPVSNASNEDSAQQSFAIVVTDKDGSSATGSLDIVIADDKPIASDDTMSLSEDAASVPGNVLTNDVAGADGGKLVTTPGTFNGTYGQLVLNADGSYVYTLKTDAATQSIIQGLSATEWLSETFDYTMKDGDGDLSSAKITLTINGADDIVTLAGLDVTGGEVKVSEANLANGTAPNAAALTVPGSFTVTSPDGMTKISIGGTEFTFAELAASSTTPLTVTTATGILTITGFVGTAAGGTVSYSYLLQSPVSNASNENSAQQSIAIVVTDKDGSSATGSLDIVITDDMPLAKAGDALIVAETAGATAGENLLANDKLGADGATVTHVSFDGGTTWQAIGNGPFIVNGVGTFTFAANGAWSLDPVVNVSAANQTGSFLYKITDGDGDTSQASQSFTVENVNTAPTASPVTIRISEEGLLKGKPDTNAGPGAQDTTNSTTASQSLNAQDAENNPLTFTFTSAPTGLKSGTQDIAWTGIGTSQLVGKVGATTIITLSINSAGLVTAALSGPLDHATGLGENELQFHVGVNVSDGQLSTTTSATIVVEDDQPVAISPVAAVLLNKAGAPVTFSLDGDANVSNNYGADGPGTVRFPSNLQDSNSGLTSGGKPIIYTLSSDGLVLTGKAGTVTIFTVTLNPSNSTYSVDMDGRVDSYTRVDFTSSQYTLTGGNTAWVGFVPPGQATTTGIDDDSRDLLVTPILGGAPSSTINSSNNAFGVGGGASVDTGEGVRLDFVTDLRGNTSGSGGYSVGANRDHLFDGHYITNGATILFKSTSGSTVKFQASDDPDGVNNNVVGDGANDPITAVSITFSGETKLLTSTTTSTVIGGSTFTLTWNADGTVDIGGIRGNSGSSLVGTQVAIFTADGYNSLVVTNVGTSGFQIGGFGASVPTDDPVAFDLPIAIIDADGDAVSASINIALAPGDSAIQDYSDYSHGGVWKSANSFWGQSIIGTDNIDWLEGSNANNVLSGGQGDDELYGYGGNDILLGGHGNDYLSGGSGDDILIGGAGIDELHGGTGKDTFVFTDLDARDVILDFNNTDDTIDLTALLNGLAPNANLETDGYVRITAASGGSLLQVDVDGGANNWVDVALLQGYTFNSAAEAVKILFQDTSHEVKSDQV